jgi:hypothetical protein
MSRLGISYSISLASAYLSVTIIYGTTEVVYKSSESQVEGVHKLERKSCTNFLATKPTSYNDKIIVGRSHLEPVSDWAVPSNCMQRLRLLLGRAMVRVLIGRGGRCQERAMREMGKSSLEFGETEGCPRYLYLASISNSRQWTRLMQLEIRVLCNPSANISVSTCGCIYCATS